MVYNVKHDGRLQAVLVADGHKTETPLESVYSGVVSLQGLCIVLFLAELNQLETWSTDVKVQSKSKEGTSQLYQESDWLPKQNETCYNQVSCGKARLLNV